jgi:hypothetical protein
MRPHSRRWRHQCGYCFTLAMTGCLDLTQPTQDKTWKGPWIGHQNRWPNGNIILTSIDYPSEFQTTLVWPLPLAQVLPRPQLIFPSKTWFFGTYLNFQWQKSLKNQYLSHSEFKPYQINFIKSCSSRSFQQHQRHIPIPLKISATI